jgi:hypothetical protein
MPGTPWTIEQIIRDTFEAFRRSWLQLVVAELVMFGICLAPMGTWAIGTFLPTYLAGRSDFMPSTLAWVLLAPALVSTIVLASLFAPALTCMALSALGHERPRIGDIFHFRRAGTFFLATLCMGLLVGLGFLCFLVPGFIALTGLALVPFFVVDGPRPLDFGEVLTASWEATRGQRLHIFGLMFLWWFVNLILQSLLELSPWLLPLQLGRLLIEAPISTLGLAALYLRLRPQSEPQEPNVFVDPLLTA